MDDKKATRHKVNILLFGVATFALSLILAEAKAQELYIAQGGGLTNEELYRTRGDLGPFFVGYFSMFIFYFIAPLIFVASGLIIYSIGYLVARKRADQSKYRNYWLVYPAFSVIILIGYYLFFLSL